MHVQLGLDAIKWVADERGLGGGREMEGLAWVLGLSDLWEQYVESVITKEAAAVGASVKSARQGQTTFPIHWVGASHRSIGQLIPDLVVRRGNDIQVVDAKYKSHMAELDDRRWSEFSEETQAAHRADFHQILAYAALFDAERITATLVYPLRPHTYETLRALGKDISRASLHHGGRELTVELRGLPFGVPVDRAA